MYQEVITFWFVENGHKQWKNFFDKLINHRFRGGFIIKVSKKKPIDWAQHTTSSLVLIIILDQFS